MPNKTPLWAVVQKVQSGRITEREVRQFFIVEPNPQQPFDLFVGINTERVDVSNVENLALLADPLVEGAGRSLDLRNKRVKRTSRYRRKSPIIAEGDSWFKLPAVIYPRTLIDFLQQKYSIVNLAHWGDTLADMLLVGEFWPYLDTNPVVSDVLLFSAGGNDILGAGELWRFLNLFDVDHDKPSDAPYYVKQEFYDNLDVVIQNYESLLQQIQSRRNTKKTIVVGHGYDYVIPRADGPWLGGPLMRQGLDPVFRPKLCQAIVRILIDAFNSRLKILQNNYPKNFRYVNLRGTINPNEWFDELHPREVGARKTAAKFAAVLESLPASGTVTAPIAVFHPQLLRAA